MSKKKMPWPYLSTKVHDSVFHIFAICQLVCFSSVLESLFYVTLIGVMIIGVILKTLYTGSVHFIFVSHFFFQFFHTGNSLLLS